MDKDCDLGLGRGYARRAKRLTLTEHKTCISLWGSIYSCWIWRRKPDLDVGQNVMEIGKGRGGGSTHGNVLLSLSPVGILHWSYTFIIMVPPRSFAGTVDTTCFQVSESFQFLISQSVRKGRRLCSPLQVPRYWMPSRPQTAYPSIQNCAQQFNYTQVWTL